MSSFERINIVVRARVNLRTTKSLKKSLIKLSSTMLIQKLLVISRLIVIFSNYYKYSFVVR